MGRQPIILPNFPHKKLHENEKFGPDRVRIPGTPSPPNLPMTVKQRSSMRNFCSQFSKTMAQIFYSKYTDLEQVDFFPNTERLLRCLQILSHRNGSRSHIKSINILAITQYLKKKSKCSPDHLTLIWSNYASLFFIYKYWLFPEI